jgi:hypothetical protein
VKSVVDCLGVSVERQIGNVSSAEAVCRQQEAQLLNLLSQTTGYWDIWNVMAFQSIFRGFVVHYSVSFWVVSYSSLMFSGRF